MNTESELTSAPGEPAVARRGWRVSLIWLVPAVAALIGLSMLAQAWLETGPEISVTFRTAAGLEAGKTPVKFKDVTVGTVTGIRLSEDGSRVVATISLEKSAQDLTRADTRFWVVRPRIGAAGVSGVDTLLSGAYIGVDRGGAAATSKSFTGLEAPPTVAGDMPGKSFVLSAADLGSLDIGSQVYYRRVPVGRLDSYRLAEDGKSVRLRIFVDAPYDRFVTSNTRFWNASGLDVSLGADGFRLRTQSVATIVSGGIAFAAPEHDPGGPAAADAVFALAADQAAAMAPPDGEALFLQLRFEQPVPGLAVGAPVVFSGVDVGRVAAVGLDYDEATLRFPTVVGLQVYPSRLGRALDKLRRPNEADPQRQMARFLGEMVARGLRAQARPANLLTGQLYVSIEYLPDAPKAKFDETARPLTLPTVGGGLERLQEQLAGIVARIDAVPFDAIGKNLASVVAKLDRMPIESIGKRLDAAAGKLDGALGALDKVLADFDGKTRPEAEETLRSARRALDAAGDLLADDAPLRQDLLKTLQETQRAARALRALADQLGRAPESLLLGRPADPAPGEPEPPPRPAQPGEETAR
ncbi:MAG: MlaD family protein [Candidatus Accumulibacter sp.]|jgi:paraquat-inducible protein B|nr:MlaD family protein [Accumulibacter sp.]